MGQFVDNLIIILAVLIISIAISIFLLYDETYKEAVLAITSVAGFILALIQFFRNKRNL